MQKVYPEFCTIHAIVQENLKDEAQYLEIGICKYGAPLVIGSDSYI